MMNDSLCALAMTAPDNWPTKRSSTIIVADNKSNNSNGHIPKLIANEQVCDSKFSANDEVCHSTIVANEEEVSNWKRGEYEHSVYRPPSWYTSILVLFSYAIMIAFAKIADWLRANGYIRIRNAVEIERQKVVCILLHIM